MSSWKNSTLGSWPLGNESSPPPEWQPRPQSPSSTSIATSHRDATDQNADRDATRFMARTSRNLGALHLSYYLQPLHRSPRSAGLTESFPRHSRLTRLNPRER